MMKACFGHYLQNDRIQFIENGKNANGKTKLVDILL